MQWNVSMDLSLIRKIEKDSAPEINRAIFYEKIRQTKTKNFIYTDGLKTCSGTGIGITDGINYTYMEALEKECSVYEA